MSVVLDVISEGGDGCDFDGESCDGSDACDSGGASGALTDGDEAVKEEEEDEEEEEDDDDGDGGDAVAFS